MTNRRTHLTQPPIGVADIVLNIGIGRVTKRGELERRDCTIPVRCEQCLLADLEIGIELRQSASGATEAMVVQIGQASAVAAVSAGVTAAPDGGAVAVLRLGELMV